MFRPPYALATLIIVLAGCETFAEADPADHDPVLAVDAVFEADVPWSITVEETVPLGSDERFVFVEDATVTVTRDDGEVVVLPHVGRGRYGANYLPVFDGRPAYVDDPLFEDGPAPAPGHTYTLSVSAPRHAVVTATSEAPPAPSLAVRLLGGWVPDEGATFDTASDPDLEIDLAGETGARHEVFFVTSDTDAPFGLRTYTFSTSTPVLTASTFFDDLQGTGAAPTYLSAFLDPASFPAGSGSFEIVGRNAGSQAAGVHVLTASAEYFEYQRSQAQARSAESNPFAEPVRPFSNVRGGAGVFAGRSRARALLTR